MVSPESALIPAISEPLERGGGGGGKERSGKRKNRRNKGEHVEGKCKRMNEKYVYQPCPQAYSSSTREKEPGYEAIRAWEEKCVHV